MVQESPWSHLKDRWLADEDVESQYGYNDDWETSTSLIDALDERSRRAYSHLVDYALDEHARLSWESWDVVDVKRSSSLAPSWDLLSQASAGPSADNSWTLL